MSLILMLSQSQAFSEQSSQASQAYQALLGGPFPAAVLFLGTKKPVFPSCPRTRS